MLQSLAWHLIGYIWIARNFLCSFDFSLRSFSVAHKSHSGNKITGPEYLCGVGHITAEFQMAGLRAIGYDLLRDKLWMDHQWGSRLRHGSQTSSASLASRTLLVGNSQFKLGMDIQIGHTAFSCSTRGQPKQGSCCKRQPDGSEVSLAYDPGFMSGRCVGT